MLPSAEDVQALWLEQLATMRKAIADLNLPAAEGQKPPAYGDDLEFDEDDFSGTASGEDIWDIISDEYEEEYSSDNLVHLEHQPARSIYSQEWLAEKCNIIAQRSSGLDAGALKEQISAILASDSDGKSTRSRYKSADD
jgi:antiviral helicase SLH1